MKVSEREHASAGKRRVRMPFFREYRWLLIGVLLLLPIGIGISLRLSRSNHSVVPPSMAPDRRNQVQDASVASPAPASKPENSLAALPNSTEQVSEPELQNQIPSPMVTGGEGRFSWKPSSSNSPIAISKITPARVRSPVYQLKSGPQKSFHPRTWLEVEVEFSARMSLPAGVVFQIAVQMSDILFTGEIVTGPLEKGEGLITVAYISPNSLRKAFSDYDDVRIEIAVVSEEEKIGGAIYNEAKRSAPVKGQFEQTIRSKADTPFAPLFWDRYVE
jgi:hypothetical protein